MLLTDLPIEVIVNCIFPWLALNDLLRVRRVCKLLKFHGDDFLGLHGATKRVIPLHLEKDGPEMPPVDLVVPVSRFAIRTEKSDSSTWDPERMAAFAKAYGRRVTHLYINALELPLDSPNALRFFESFPNLKHLTVTNLYERGYGSRRNRSLTHRTNPPEPSPVPATFKRLKTLKIVHYKSVSSNMESLRGAWQFIEECTAHLEYLCHPYNDHGQNLDWMDPRLGVGPFGVVKTMVERRRQRGEPNLKYYDLEDCHGSTTNRDFYELVTLCAENGVKLRNVRGRLIECMTRYTTPGMENHGRKISAVVASIEGLHPACFLTELPHLEKILVDGHGSLFTCDMPSWEFERKPWPQLKEIEIWVHAEGQGMETLRLFNFLFKAIRREKMTKLRLQFLCFQYHCQVGALPCPLIENVCLSCPNLKKLSIGYWPGSEEEISQIWGGLPLLEEVKLESCRDLGDAAFLGGDPAQPAILQAKRLKCLELDSLDRMPNITDRLFTHALRFLPLTQLNLATTYGGELKTVTLAGITALLSGVFAETIEKFSFADKIVLTDVSKEELLALQNKFRSANMI